MTLITIVERDKLNYDDSFLKLFRLAKRVLCYAMTELKFIGLLA